MGLNIDVGKYRFNGESESVGNISSFDGGFTSYQIGLASLFMIRGNHEGWNPYGGAGFYVKFDPSLINVEGQYSYFNPIDSTSGIRDLDEYDVLQILAPNAGIQAIFGMEKERQHGTLLLELAIRYGLTKSWSKIDLFYHELIIDLKIGYRIFRKTS
jgi:hypothetical protein